MPERVEALVEPEMLVWARKSRGLSLEDAAKKVGVKASRLADWETGEKRPTVKQLRKLGNVYKRPLAVFYLATPPKDFTPLKDFRSLSGEPERVPSPELRLEIRRAGDRRQIALELYEDLEGEPPEFSGTAGFSDDPEDLAERIRDFLGATLEDQSDLRDPYAPFNWWRRLLEDSGVLVFQATGVELSEMRGLSITETPFPTVVVNNKDAPRGRVFTMLHEFVHIMLREGGICDLDEIGLVPETRRAEVFCNRVAGAVLVPKADLLKQHLVREKGRGAKWSDEEIRKLAGRYGASREVVLRRLLICGRTTEKFYQKRRQFIEEYKSLSEHGRGLGGPPPHTRVVSYAGPLFISLVLSSYHQENITASDVSDYLNVKLKHLNQIEQAVHGYLSRIRGADLKYSVDTSAILGGWVRHYPPDVFPLIWTKLDELIDQGILVATEEVLHELARKEDEVYDWARQRPKMFVPLDAAIQMAVREILQYHERLVGQARDRSRADPFVIALARINNCAVVTDEKATAKPNRPNIPDVCNALHIRCINMLQLFREQGWVFR